MTPTTAFVLGAGLGTRLKALTQRRPKPLIPVANQPLITYAFDHLLGAGITRFIVNTHWRAEVYPETFPSGSYKGAPITFSHEFPDVLETAGGIKSIEPLLSKDAPFIVYNGDIFTDLPLGPAFEAHARDANEVTLVLRSKDGPLQIALDPSRRRVTDIGKRVEPTSEPAFLFTGIYLVEPAFLARIPPGQKLGVVPVFLDMIRTGAKLGGVVIDDGQWWDLGSREQYLAVHREFFPAQAVPWIAPNAEIAPSAKITGATAIGRGAKIGAGAILHDCLIWENAEVHAGAHLSGCIVTTEAGGTHEDADF